MLKVYSTDMNTNTLTTKISTAECKSMPSAKYSVNLSFVCKDNQDRMNYIPSEYQLFKVEVHLHMCVSIYFERVLTEYFRNIFKYF